MREKLKLKFAVLLFDMIVKLYPEGYVSAFIHDVDFKILNKNKWEIDGINAQRIPRKSFDVILFDKGN
jgi:hypothetical protein